MKYVNMHVIFDCVGWIDEFGMILACNMNGMGGYKGWYGIGMYNDLSWLEKHKFGAVRT